MQKNEAGRGGGRGGGRGRVGGGFVRETVNNENSLSNNVFSGGQGASEEPDAGKPSERRGGYSGPRGYYRGGRRSGFNNEETGDGERTRRTFERRSGTGRGGFNNEETGDGERTRRTFERRSGTGRGNEIKREGAGQGNWGTPTDELPLVTEKVVYEDEKNQEAEKPSGEEVATYVNKENPAIEAEEKEPEDKASEKDKRKELAEKE
ncbi:hypothetical protein U1Q18_035999 [Sarracenia purpurea var. burkii]